MSIFKAYDIRGLYPQEINEEVAERLGRAIARYFKTTIVVGRDTRLSSLPIFESLAEGINAEGYGVVDIGVIDTPGLYFATAHYGFGAGVMITASHNPKEYNGLKLCREDAIPVGSDSGLREIEEIFERISEIQKSKIKGNIIEKDVIEDYAYHLMKFYRKTKKSAVVDCSNGAAVRIVHKLLEKGVKLELINDEMDGNFPAHEPNPLKEENMQQLKEKTKDLGVCFDGDGDRVGVVYKGEILRNDFLTAIIARELLKENPGATILYDLRSSRVVKEEIEAAGGRALMCRVGHAFIKRQMREENALFAGELSGHFYYRDNYFADSGPITMLLLLGIEDDFMDTSRLKRYFPSGEINVEVKDIQAALKRIEERFAGKGKISYLDGISFESTDYWFNVRPSNTEPLVRINVESNNKERTQTVVRLLKDILLE
jgi:phosphomannomutase